MLGYTFSDELLPLSMLSPPSSSQLLYSVRPPLKLKDTLPLMPTVPSSCPLWLLTPGVNVANCVKFRPFNWSWEICLPVITPDSSDDCVSTWPIVPPSTVTSEEVPPTV